ncbi:MAG: NACHT domain-containing protein, partial [Alphaproteobacteria bacterium]
MVAEHDKLFILGKPGAGKTTFLKHTALRAIEREIKKTPVFVTLKELSDSGMAIVPFIVHQFEVHQFPKAETFVERLLQNGEAIVLFDGLDEVNLADNKRADLIRRLNDFVYQYSDCPILLTCRVAATDYTFTQFEYVEMADFDTEQMGRYIDQWFVYDEVKRQNCRKALLEDEENKAVRELAQVPLLLAMLCLVYEERGEFPPNRDEIYEEATRALLVKWDSSRNIARDTVYKQLSLKHKQKLLAHIAAETFEKGEYFLPEKKVVRLIEAYLQGVPGLEEPDGERVLRAMEAQHGIFVERARGIHSFSHLTLQEYYAARYIVDNEKRGTVARLMRYVGDDRWREVFLLTAGMLDDATEFGELYLEAAPRLLADDAQLLALLHWATQKGAQTQAAYRPPALRAFLLFRARARARALALALALDRALALALALDLALQVADNFGLAAFRAELETLVLPEASDDAEAWRTFAGAFAA